MIIGNHIYKVENNYLCSPIIIGVLLEPIRIMLIVLSLAGRHG